MIFVWILAIIGALFLIVKFLSANTVPTQNISPKIHNHPVRQSFESLTLNQRMSIINMLQIIGTCDLPKGDADKELQYLNSTVSILGVRAVECTSYYKSTGETQMFLNLDRITMSQKELLIMMAWDMIIIDGRPNEKELIITQNIFDEIGVTGEKFIETVKKTSALMEYFKF